ncbi:MAG TPA: phosphatase PAP2 family protein [Flavobacteriales bacterium]|nr:phosphatase PAP2 family protein [Flavobacteriales bacterium]
MVETLEQWDIDLFFAINSRHNPFFDQVFYFISHGLSWIPVYMLLFYFLAKFYGIKIALVQVLLAGAMVGLADVTSVYLFKNTVCRYRPCHNEAFRNFVHIVNDHRGGIFGFVSSHAVNFMTWTIVVFWFLKQQVKSNWLWLMFLIPLVVGYSRVYLGVHYPGDVAGGFLLGTVFGLAGILIWKRVINKRIKSR